MVMGTDAAHVLDAAARQSERGALTRRRGARVLGAWARAWGWLTSERSGPACAPAWPVERSARNSVPFLGSWSQYVSAAPSYLA